jgi:CRP/FNR family transcriptional regulator
MELNTITEFKSSKKLREKLADFGFTKKFNFGEIILNENAYIKAIPIVTTGSIRVMRIDEDGREILLYYIKAGESCIMSFLGGLHQDTSKVKAIAEEKTEILFIPIDKVSLLIKEFPEWLDYIFRLYHKRFEELLEVVNVIAFKKLDERLLNFIKKKSELTKSQYEIRYFGFDFSSKYSRLSIPSPNGRELDIDRATSLLKGILDWVFIYEFGRRYNFGEESAQIQAFRDQLVEKYSREIASRV